MAVGKGRMTRVGSDSTASRLDVTSGLTPTGSREAAGAKPYLTALSRLPDETILGCRRSVVREINRGLPPFAERTENAIPL